MLDIAVSLGHPSALYATALYTVLVLGDAIVMAHVSQLNPADGNHFSLAAPVVYAASCMLPPEHTVAFAGNTLIVGFLLLVTTTWSVFRQPSLYLSVMVYTVVVAGFTAQV
jgi:hypothetical protein